MISPLLIGIYKIKLQKKWGKKWMEISAIKGEWGPTLKSVYLYPHAANCR